MKSILALAAVLVAISLSSEQNSFAGDTASGDLMIKQPTARPNLPNRPTAGYMVIMNHGQSADVLLGASSPAFKAIELHTVKMDGHVMTMQQVKGINVPPGEKAVLAPGGYHLMLFDAVKRFKDGESFPVTLTFDQAGDVEISVQVDRRAGTDYAGHGDHSDHSNHGGHAEQGHKEDGHKENDHKHSGHKHDGASE